MRRALWTSFLILILIAGVAWWGVWATPAMTFSSPWGTGIDGSLYVPPAQTYNIHVDNHPGRSCADGGDAVYYRVIGLTSTSATLASPPQPGCLNPGDEVLLIKMDGANGDAVIDDNEGNWEFLEIASVSGNTVTFTTPKKKVYGIGSGDGGIASTEIVILQRVPHYQEVQLEGVLTGNPWEAPQGGGIIAFRVQNRLFGSGTIEATGLGWTGGAGGGCPTGYRGLGPGGGNGGTWSPSPSSLLNGKPGSYASTYGDDTLRQVFLGSGGAGGGIIIIHAFRIDVGQIKSEGVPGKAGGAADAGSVGGTGGHGSGGSIFLSAETVAVGYLSADPDGRVYIVAQICTESGASCPGNVVTPTPSPTPTPTPTYTPTPTLTPTPTPTPTSTPTHTPMPTRTPTLTLTPTSTSTSTPSPSGTGTPGFTPTPTSIYGGGSGSDVGLGPQNLTSTPTSTSNALLDMPTSVTLPSEGWNAIPYGPVRCPVPALVVQVYTDQNRDGLISRNEGVDFVRVTVMDVYFSVLAERFTYQGLAVFCIPPGWQDKTLYIEVVHLYRSAQVQIPKKVTKDIVVQFQVPYPLLPVSLPEVEP